LKKEGISRFSIVEGILMILILSVQTVFVSSVMKKRGLNMIYGTHISGLSAVKIVLQGRMI
jgi:hypothetical protein